ncbi:NAD-dependent epimerase/dehydratase family protein [Negadavirga shengliensis]|uniref:NAD-dependent epimerase/dehydratase family protein n=1 Tax=Negadavirga shengliensis TaxID=1389218 RepID=A0ABV9T6A0_9BACT
MKRILIIGGAGFIGSHLTDELIREGYAVRILDNLSPQVHEGGKLPSYLNKNTEFFYGDVRDPIVLKRVLKGVDAVFHLAAKVGVGQSMYQIRSYTETNNLGTATLLEALVDHPVQKLIVASSMSIYGEGLYLDSKSGNTLDNCRRDLSALKEGIWDIHDHTGSLLEPLPVNEEKKPNLSSVYALSKYDQERLCMMVGEAYNIPTTALRFFNVYGTRQSLSNPYTGVLAIFASRLLNDHPPLIFEDGLQLRDFVHVKDVARACLLSLESESVNGEAINIGSGQKYTVRYIADTLAKIMDKTSVGYQLTATYRKGDIRHCFADISKAAGLLGYSPQISLEDGLQELSEWLRTQLAIDRVNMAKEELELRGLTL